MPIEFRCPGCQKLLRTPDGTGGRQAKCPVCGTLVAIPDPADPPALPSAAASPQAASPSLGEPRAAVTIAPLPPAGEHARLLPVPINVAEILWTTWRLLLREPGSCIAAALIVAVLSLAVIKGVDHFTAPDRAAIEHFEVLVFDNYWWMRLAQTLVVSVLLAGQAVFFLNVARGSRPDVADVLTGWHWAWHAFASSLLVALIVIVGVALCVIPGIIAALMLSQTIYFVVDRNAGAFEAIEMSRDVTTGNKGSLFLLLLVVLVGYCLAAITCGLGLIIVLPWTGLLMAVTYLRLTGQPTAGM